MITHALPLREDQNGLQNTSLSVSHAEVTCYRGQVKSAIIALSLLHASMAAAQRSVVPSQHTISFAPSSRQLSVALRHTLQLVLLLDRVRV